MKHTRTITTIGLSLLLGAALAAAPMQGTTKSGQTTSKSSTTTTKSTQSTTKKASATWKPTTIQVSELPSAANDTIMKAYPGSTITKAAKLTQGTNVRYEAWVKKGTKTTPVVLNDQGTTIISPKQPAGKK